MKKIFFISMLFLNGLIFSQESGKCVAGDCENGEGTWIWDHGDKFEGHWEQGLYIAIYRRLEKWFARWIWDFFLFKRR